MKKNYPLPSVVVNTNDNKDNGSFLPKKCCPRLSKVVVNKKKVYQQV